MCGRYGFSVKDAREVYTRFNIANTLDTFAPRWNIAPGQMNPIITKHSPNKIERMFWGLIPHWAKDETMRYKTINARAEGIEEKPTYKKPFRFQRCLVPATFFFEWDKAHKPSIPYVFKLKTMEIFAFAGLYDTWKDPKTNNDILSYTIITTTPNKTVKAVHDRMPVILHKDDEEGWLNPDTIEPERLKSLLIPYPNIEMESYPVSNMVNNPKIDNENIIKHTQIKEENSVLLNSK